MVAVDRKMRQRASMCVYRFPAVVMPLMMVLAVAPLCCAWTSTTHIRSKSACTRGRSAEEAAGGKSLATGGSEAALGVLGQGSVWRSRDSTSSLGSSGSSSDGAEGDYRYMLETAELAARAAGALMMEHMGADVVKTKANFKDVVTEYDMKAQESIYDIVRKRHPSHSFFGEESVASGSKAAAEELSQAFQELQVDASSKAEGRGFVWIVDPIDGTANFAMGLPLCCVSIGVAQSEAAAQTQIPQTVVGLVYNPALDEMYTAIKGQGAFLNGEKLTPSRRAKGVSDSVVNMGCPAASNAFAASFKAMKVLSTRAMGLRMVACAAQVLSWIAAGKISAYCGYDLSCWDIAAGVLIIQEAGGEVTSLTGGAFELTDRDILASTGGKAHSEILAVVEEAGASRYET